MRVGGASVCGAVAFALTIAVSGVGALGLAGCGGKIGGATDRGDDDSGEPDDGGPEVDVIVVADAEPPPDFDSGPVEDSEPPIFDAEPPPDDAPVGDANTCLADLVPCISGPQCCSGTCQNGQCGVTPPPTCILDGVACSTAAECCSGDCVGNVCEEPPGDAGPPPVCSTPSGSGAGGCMMCLVSQCCSQLGACQTDAECSLALACFQGCWTQGSGTSCSQKCNAMFPSPAVEQPLTQCAAGFCASSCE